MEIPITIITTGILGLIFFAHSVRTIQARVRTKTSLGDGGNDLMIRRIRTHANFAEYIPLLLFILFLLEIKGVKPLFLMGFGLIIVIGRLLHFYGLYSKETQGFARVWGMQFTLWPLVIGSGYLLFLGVSMYW